MHVTRGISIVRAIAVCVAAFVCLAGVAARATADHLHRLPIRNPASKASSPISSSTPSLGSGRAIVEFLLQAPAANTATATPTISW